jgi:hypothetical protein
LASERAKKNKYGPDVELEGSSIKEKGKDKKSTTKRKFGFTTECPIFYREKGVWTKRVALCRVTKNHSKSQRRCKDHEG